MNINKTTIFYNLQKQVSFNAMPQYGKMTQDNKLRRGILVCERGAGIFYHNFSDFLLP